MIAVMGHSGISWKCNPLKSQASVRYLLLDIKEACPSIKLYGCSFVSILKKSENVSSDNRPNSMPNNFYITKNVFKEKLSF